MGGVALFGSSPPPPDASRSTLSWTKRSQGSSLLPKDTMRLMRSGIFQRSHETARAPSSSAYSKRSTASMMSSPHALSCASRASARSSASDNAWDSAARVSGTGMSAKASPSFAFTASSMRRITASGFLLCSEHCTKCISTSPSSARSAACCAMHAQIDDFPDPSGPTRATVFPPVPHTKSWSRACVVRSRRESRSSTNDARSLACSATCAALSSADADSSGRGRSSASCRVSSAPTRWLTSRGCAYCTACAHAAPCAA
mmetsp:Transcript_19489/g.46249  ORF Transcript_19489/g.46249 Transcript_19489/m.46249 type:complete len:259 (+) Transcript_19489:660-1436(+)